MASSSEPRKVRQPKKGKKPRRTHFRKHLIQPRNKAFNHKPAPEPEPEPEDLPCSLSSTTTTTTSSVVDDTLFPLQEANEEADNSPATSSGCCTPKAHRFRIPEIATCPPAPKKQRVMSNCTLRRRPIAFFAPPDIELFFVFALGEQVN